MSEWKYVRLTGKKGDSGSELLALYSAQNTVRPENDSQGIYWHQDILTTDYYMCTKVNNTESQWGSIVKIRAEQLEIMYSQTGTGTPATQPSLWHFPYASGDKYIIQRMDNGNWGSSAKFIGDDGQDGENAVVITALSPANPQGSFTGQVGNYNGTLYQWINNAWTKIDAVKQAELTTAQAAAVSTATANIATYAPRYIGAFSSPPTVSSYHAGDWYLNTTGKTIHVSTGSSWGSATSYTNANKHYFEAAANDIMQNADTTNTSNAISQFAIAFIQHLFAKNITITDGGCIQSSNYVEGVQGRQGFKIDYQGDSVFNSTDIRGSVRAGNIVSNVKTGKNYTFKTGDYVSAADFGNGYIEGTLEQEGEILQLNRVIEEHSDKVNSTLYFGLAGTDGSVTNHLVIHSNNHVYEIPTDDNDEEITITFRFTSEQKGLIFAGLPEFYPDEKWRAWNDRGTIRIREAKEAFYSISHPVQNGNIGSGTKYYVLDRAYRSPDKKPSSIPEGVTNIAYIPCFANEDLLPDEDTSAGTPQIKMVLISIHCYENETVGFYVDSDILNTGIGGVQIARVSNSGRQATNTFTIPVRSWFSVRQSASVSGIDLQIYVLGYYHI